MTAACGRQRQPCCPSGSACAWPCWPACMQPTALGTHTPQLSRQPGELQPGHWRSCAQPCSATGSWWEGACAGQEARALHGTEDGSRGSRREAFQERWCHRGVLCSLTAGDGEPLFHWSAAAPVPLPA